MAGVAFFLRRKVSPECADHQRAKKTEKKGNDVDRFDAGVFPVNESGVFGAGRRSW